MLVTLAFTFPFFVSAFASAAAATLTFSLLAIDLPELRRAMHQALRCIKHCDVSSIAMYQGTTSVVPLCAVFVCHSERASAREESAFLGALRVLRALHARPPKITSNY
ncbi:MAG: hypothetical protein LAN70_12285 [Acidobacteriia bacterium]|nr:hypothetical protein [Terriglobia bacterium]